MPHSVLSLPRQRPARAIGQRREGAARVVHELHRVVARRRPRLGDALAIHVPQHAVGRVHRHPAAGRVGVSEISRMATRTPGSVPST